jgi:hypothetical protein
MNALSAIKRPPLPALVAAAGGRAGMRFLEFFAANRRNPQHYPADVLDRIAGYPARKIADLLPWTPPTFSAPPPDPARPHRAATMQRGRGHRERRQLTDELYREHLCLDHHSRNRHAAS